MKRFDSTVKGVFSEILFAVGTIAIGLIAATLICGA
jgi:hypothetical protein